LLLGLASVVLLPGCAWVRAQAQHRSEECNQLCDKAAAARQAGHSAQADALLNAAVKKSPADSETQRQLADSLWTAGRRPESLKILERLADDNPQDLRFAIRLSERLVELDRSAEALQRLQGVLSSDPNNLSALELKARIESQQGDLESALASYQRLCHQKTVSVGTLLALGDLYLQRNQPDRAAPLFRMALVDSHATAADQLRAQWQLGMAYYQAERWAEAADQLAQAAARREMNADDWHLLGLCQFRTGDLPAARQSLNGAFNLQPNHLPSRELAALIQQNLSPAASAARLSRVNFENIGSKPASPR
jgi:tetratricopeptide (TPR) repeat protein